VIDLIDTMFSPLLGWLTDLYNRILMLSVPLGRPLDLSNYFGFFKILGSTWMMVISQMIGLSVIYFIVWVVVNNLGVISKFKMLIKWW